MDILFNIKHFANKTLLTFFGPADLDDHADPRVALRREYDIRKGRPVAPLATAPSGADVPTSAALPAASRTAA